MGGRCELAALDEARAYSTGTTVIITASGSVPESCWEVTINQNLLTDERPEFVLERCRTGGICLQVITPYATSREFDIVSQPAEIVLHYAGDDGPAQKRIRVEPIPTERTTQTVAEGGDPDEVTGWSLGFSVDSALANAIGKLAGDSGQPVSGTVTSIQASQGGIVGPQTTVTVRRGGPA